MLRLLIEDSEGKSKIAPINPDSEITIGRKEGNSIRLKERNVSRQHARIYSTSEGMFVEPVAARYGVKVNSSKIDGPTKLSPGDEIRIGDYRLYIQDESQPDPREQANPDEVVEISPSARPRFVVISSNFAGCEYVVTKTCVVIGRNPQSDIQIQHMSVSDAHAEVRRTPRGEFHIRDLGSSNGTKVDGVLISEPTYLYSGNIITLGHVSMRFCAPGDLWTLNFGHSDDRGSRVSIPLLVLLMIVFVVMAIGGTAYVMTTKYSNKPAPVSVAQLPQDSAKQHDDFIQYITECEVALQEGRLDDAQDALDKATRIDAASPLLQTKNRQLQLELEANRTLEDIKSSLVDGRCNDARDRAASLKVGTFANTRYNDEKIKHQIDGCLIDSLYTRALDAIKNGDLATAENNLDEIYNIDRQHPKYSKLNDAIREAKPSRSSGSGGSRDKDKDKAAAAAATAEAPKPKPAAVNADELCRQAGPLVSSGKECDAYKLYKKALSAGNASSGCNKIATMRVNQLKTKCE